MGFEPTLPFSSVRQRVFGSGSWQDRLRSYGFEVKSQKIDRHGRVHRLPKACQLTYEGCSAPSWVERPFLFDCAFDGDAMPVRSVKKMPPSAICLPPFAVAHADDALGVRAAVSAGVAACCNTSRRQQCCRPHFCPPRNAGGGARRCSAGPSAAPAFCSSHVRLQRLDHPTSAGRNSSSALPVQSFSSYGYFSVLPWHGLSIQLREKRRRDVPSDAPR